MHDVDEGSVLAEVSREEAMSCSLQLCLLPGRIWEQNVMVNILSYDFLNKYCLVLNVTFLQWQHELESDAFWLMTASLSDKHTIEWKHPKSEVYMRD